MIMMVDFVLVVGQLELICRNILNSFGLDENGDPISQVLCLEIIYKVRTSWFSIWQSTEEDDAEKLALKSAIKVSISRQHDETFAALAYAAKAGDVELVRHLIRRGAEINHSDYDGRTVLAMVGKELVEFNNDPPTDIQGDNLLFKASFEGSYKVVELLLEEGAEKNTKNRWGQTPLQEAMENRQVLGCSPTYLSEYQTLM